MNFPACLLTVAIILPGFLAVSAVAQTGAPGVSHNQIIADWGWVLAQEKKLNGVELSDSELALFIQGFREGAAGEPANTNFRSAYFDIQVLAKLRREKMVRAITQKNEAESAAYLKKIKSDAAQIGLPDNVWCRVLNPGTNDHPKLNQTVTVHYTAHLIDGTEFSQMGPVDMVLVTNRNVCRGWSDALQRIGPGGALKLYVPPPLSESEADSFGIQPGSLMIFDVELFSIADTKPDDLAAAQMGAAPEPPPAALKFPASELVEMWGWLVERESHADKYNLSAAEITALVQGLTTAIRGGPSPDDVQRAYPAVQQYLGEQEQRAVTAANQKRLAQGEALFAELKKDTNVIELPDGLRYQILRTGSGSFPRTGQRVTVLYTGRLIDGTVFDSTELGPLDIDLDKVISGWSEGVQKINPGGKIKLYIPPGLAYRDVATSGIPADSTLIYEVELLEIK